MKIGSYSVPIMIAIIILTIILPVPGAVLDILLAVNIIISAIILFNSIYMKDSLELSIFPSMLVITTIFRLALNITAAKLILSRGEAGRVIYSFGRFVGQGNLVVGFIIFFTLMIVNFLVITRGTERVAEVAARFTLDAMPGKQMAIDADLSAGLIDENEAKKRRKAVQLEADFYGAMDGATKFVKNDAIASIIITFLNIAGGLIIGMVMRGESFDQASETYVILTIGNGLVNQVPALMVSTATSFIVTRAGSESSISQDLLKQLAFNPKVMFLSAALCAGMAPILSPVPFLLLAALLAFTGFKLKNLQEEVQRSEKELVQESEVEEIRKPESAISLLHVDPIEFEFGYSIIPFADAAQGGDLPDRFVMIRRQLALELGMIVPAIRLRDNIQQLAPNEYIFKIKGVEVARGELMVDHLMAMNPGFVEEKIEGIETTEPAFGLPSIWISEDQRDRAEALGYTVVDPPTIISTHLTEVIKKYAHELLGRQEVQTLIENLKQSYPAVVEELTPKLLSVGEIQKVLANLLKEGVSIRDLVTIFETLADYAPITRDTDLLTEYARQALGRAITKKFMSDGKNGVITLDPGLEQVILDSIQRNEYGAYLAMEPSLSNKIINNLTNQVQKLLQLGQQPIVLASPVVRFYFKRLTENAIPGLVVLSYNELDPGMEIRSVGTVSV